MNPPASPVANAEFGALFTRCVAQHGRFGHPAHLHLAWLLLEKHSALEGLAIFNAGLLALARRLKLTDKYNATLTTIFFFLVLERREDGQTWDEFAAQHADLLDWDQREKFLAPFYDLESLNSETAQQGFLMPRPPENRG
ncbi:hypothetical protein [Deinococcus marmoris]|uniref:Uncharacterized protein n=1 Tax=Deinococcus marmoris TaxID=249408 RepID=A0A1U7NSH5_9DEIO|nr:hypothetical protein [Deinococcus marmoris]OLV15866.1 hypothetical protein BOO71_0013714 [Deinococcus marmoris]